MALLSRKRVILVEAESTYASDPGMQAADAVQVRDLSITPQSSDTVSRDLVRPYLGASEQLQANTRVECSFSVEMAGSGTAGTAPRYGDALKAAGLSETIVANTSVTYAPVSGSFSSIAIHYNVDGVRHIVTGCRGNASFNCAVGEIPTIDFTFTGIYNAPTDNALPTVSYGNQASPLIFKNGNTSAFQLFSHSGSLNSLSMDLGNQVQYRELVGGSKEVLLLDRQVTGSCQIEAVLMATKDYFAAALNDGTLGNLTFLHGTAAGNKVQLTSSRVDLGDISYGDDNGVTMLEVPYTATPSSAGNDEVSLIYT